MNFRRVLLRALQVALLVAIAVGIYRLLAPTLAQLTWADVLRWRPHPVPLVLSFVLLVGVYFAHALLWRRIMRDLAIADPSVRTTIRIYFLAGLARYLPFKALVLPGFAILAKQAGLPPGSATAAALLGQFGFLTTGLLMLGLSLPEWRAALGRHGAGVPVEPLALGAALLVLGGAALWVLVATPLGHHLRQRSARLLGGRAGEKLTAAFALADRVRPGLAVSWAAGYMLTWIALGGAFALFAAAFAPEAVIASPRFVAGTVAASYVIGYVLVLAPAGLGVREAAMILLLQQVMPQPGLALVVSVLSRVWFTAAELVPLALLPALRSGKGTQGEQ